MTDSLLQQGKIEGWYLNEELKAALISPAAKITNYDPVSSTTAYLGMAVVGSAGSAAVWQIRRLTFSAGGGVITAYADGDNLFNNVWDDRLSLSYS